MNSYEQRIALIRLWLLLDLPVEYCYRREKLRRAKPYIRAKPTVRHKQHRGYHERPPQPQLFHPYKPLLYPWRKFRRGTEFVNNTFYAHEQVRERLFRVKPDASSPS